MSPESHATYMVTMNELDHKPYMKTKLQTALFQMSIGFVIQFSHFEKAVRFKVMTMTNPTRTGDDVIKGYHE